MSVPLGSRLLKCGKIGADVKVIQELLLQLRYKLQRYGADGEYGAETEAAVRAFQKDEPLEVDGKYGDETHKALVDAVADDDAADEPAQPSEEKPKSPQAWRCVSERAYTAEQSTSLQASAFASAC